MLSRFSSAPVLSLFLVSMVTAQTIRFDTNVGTFDMDLNPTGNSNLQQHVDNMLAYVEAKRYDLTVINRAHTGFVMQMGGFKAESLTLPDQFDEFNAIESFNPVIVDVDGDSLVDFDLTGLNNTTGTVSLALSSDVNTGSSSFFVNLDNNTNLDSDSLRFVPFAVIPDMATVDLIMSLDQANYPGSSLASENVPALPGGRMVFVERAYVLEVPTTDMTALAESSVSSGTSEQTAAATAPPTYSPAFVVPEPSTIALAGLALFAAMAMSRRKLT